jgi:hypothetical protein
LRSIGKFNTRHLWSNVEIAKAEPKAIWELLDDIWHYYTSKSVPSNEAKIKKTHSLKNIKLNKANNQVKFNITNSFNDDIHTPEPETNRYVENYININKHKTYTDLADYQKMISLNINKAMSSKIKNDSRSDPNILEDCLGIKKKKKIKYI